MKIAVIDLGTNTFNLLIAELSDNGLSNILHTSVIPVLIGQGCFETKLLTNDSIKRGILAIEKQIEIAKSYGVSKLFAFATSAIRNADNKNIFIDEIKSKYGVTINVISGDREAELIYEGVKLALSIEDNLSLIVDIGGGSTEFIISDNNKIYWKKSFDIGAALILEKFKPSDPITKDEFQQIEMYLEEELHPLFEALKDFPVETIIGSSGSFDTFAEMIAYKFYSADIIKNKTEYSFNLSDYKDIHNQLLNSTREERINTKGLIEMRVDMMVVATILVNFILEKSEIQKMRLSTYSLKEGVMAEIVRESFTPTELLNNIIQ